MVMGEAIGSGSFVANSSQDEGAVPESPRQMQGCGDCELYVFTGGNTQTKTSWEENAVTNTTFRSCSQE
jgi:hypothetical protein